MAKFAPVAPIQVLEGLYAHSPETFGDYHLLLAHHTVAHKARFADLFKRIADDGHNMTIIMDNSIVELGSAVDSEMIHEAVCSVHHGQHKVYPVLPDVMGEGLETLEAINGVYKDWENNMAGTGFMAVCQGKDLDDFQHSLHYLADEDRFPAIEILGIPRILVKTCGSRIRPALMAKDLPTNHKIHFLGFSDNITDDIDACLVLPEAGIDSAVPLRYKDVFTEYIDAGKRAPDWFDKAQVDKRMIDNLNAARLMFTSAWVS